MILCGNCHHKGYYDPLSEWYCKKHRVLLGYSIQAYKCRQCSIIGQDGDVKQISAMFAFLEEQNLY